MTTTNHPSGLPEQEPVDPTGGDPVVLARVDGDTNRRVLPRAVDGKRVLFRGEDGSWSGIRGAIAGVWPTERLYDIERLSSQTIAELMGGAA